MNWDRAKGEWKQMKGQVRAHWGKLTDDQLDVIAGRRDQMVGKLQEAYGYAREEAERQVGDFEQRHGDVFTRATRPGNGRELLDAAAKAGSDLAHQTASSARTLGEAGRTLAGAQLDATAQRIRAATYENPMRTIGIAAAAGLVLGLIIGRR